MSRWNVPTVWIVAGVGVALWIIGSIIDRHRGCAGRPSKGARVFYLLAVAAIGLAAYAGFRGPLKVGSFSIGPFPFTAHFTRSDEQAGIYAHTQLAVSCAPAPGWRGASKTSLQYTVRNTGDRTISCLILRYATTDAGQGGGTIDLKLPGPFSARRTTSSVMNLPPNVNRSYFKATPNIDSGHIVGARF